ncbi:hypothetical protein DVH05_016612 [Phytophthora capsici]|nr:hypothetical protein DVH05_016612 [Phytophthora capsici]
MRASKLLLMTVFLLASLDATSGYNKLQGTNTEVVDGTQRGVNSERLLRGHPSTVDKVSADDEERASLPIFLKKSTSGATNWLKDKKLAAKLKLRALPMNLDKSVQKTMKDGIDPDRVFTLLNLQKKSNRKINGFRTGEYNLWKELTVEWTKTYPNWVSNISKKPK